MPRNKSRPLPLVGGGLPHEEPNPLRRYLQQIGMSELKAMNVLQDHGVISDNCVKLDEVGNYARAMIWIDERRREGKL
jgi:hypothetical protein